MVDANYKNHGNRRRISPFRGIRFEDKQAKKYFEHIDLKFKCFTSHVYFRGTVTDVTGMGDELRGGYCVSDRRAADLVMSKKTKDWLYASNYANFKPKSYKAFVRWCKKQIVPEGTVFIMEHTLAHREFRYTYKLKKREYGKTLIIPCWRCQNPKTLRNLIQSYDVIRCNIDKRIVARKGEGIL